MDPYRRRLFGRRPQSSMPFRPPWSVPELAFVDVCVRCDDCVRACPTRLLRRGDGGFPEADFTSAVCTFCGECAHVCASGAIARDVSRAPWSFTVRMDDRCLARQRVECRVCGEACDVSAIRFRPVVGGVPVPELDEGACTACGACLRPCPAGAIVRVARAERSAAPAMEAA